MTKDSFDGKIRRLVLLIAIRVIRDDMPRKIVYISSRAHSGSTLLSLLMSGHPRLIALGEIVSLFGFKTGYNFKQGEIKCSCGAVMRCCPFWGPVTGRLLENEKLPLQEMYNLVTDAFFDYFGEQYIPIDASKTLDGLKLCDEQDITLNVLFLLRDVRPWVISMMKDRVRKKDFYIEDLVRQYGIKAPWEFVMRTPYKYFWHWYLLNRQTQNYLAQKQIPTFQLGYEEVSLYPEMIAGKICQFLDLSYDPAMLSIETSESHVLLGNRMRNEQEKRIRIYYDNRWFYNNDWLLPSFLFPHIMKYNAREVYQNTQKHIWNR